MCGLAGFVLEERQPISDPCSTLMRMGDAIRYRGPDDQGCWFDGSVGVGFAHRRLSIVDLSPNGHQPMTSSSGRYVIAYNGEVYNFRALRQELELHHINWRGHSDTEVILEAIEVWGLERAVKRFVGMFAFALWDNQYSTLHLVRDRLGIKPLYYGRVNGVFLFASELKALREFPGFQPQIDRDSLALLLRHNYIPAPHCIYRGMRKLLPGHMLTLSKRQGLELPRSTPYWSANEVAAQSVNELYEGTDEEAVLHLEELLRDAVALRMIADVPVGAFLSGGIDSSTVVALMQAQLSQRARTFSIGFDESSYDEARHAKRVAQHLGTEHTELYVTAEEAMAVIPDLPVRYDEPFSDSSQVPTFIVSRLAGEDVTVCLSGDGGDELFCGYNRYFWAEKIWKQIGWAPGCLRSVTSRLLSRISPGSWNKVFSLLEPALPKKYGVHLPGHKLYKLGELLGVRDEKELYLYLLSHSMNPASIVLDSQEPSTLITEAIREPVLRDYTQHMMLTDLTNYLPDDILTKIDRASMSVSLEVRVPLLDHRVVEFSWQLPMHMKYRNGQGKWILRELLAKYLPRELVDRPKMGFGIPIDEWLRGPLRDWGEALLDERRLRSEGYFDPEPIRSKWNEHINDKGHWHYYLWNVLMFQSWLETQSASSA